MSEWRRGNSFRFSKKSSAQPNLRGFSDRKDSAAEFLCLRNYWLLLRRQKLHVYQSLPNAPNIMRNIEELKRVNGKKKFGVTEIVIQIRIESGWNLCTCRNYYWSNHSIIVRFASFFGAFESDCMCADAVALQVWDLVTHFIFYRKLGRNRALFCLPANTAILMQYLL